MDGEQANDVGLDCHYRKCITYRIAAREGRHRATGIGSKYIKFGNICTVDVEIRKRTDKHADTLITLL